MSDKKQRVALGSGKLYLIGFDGTIPENNSIETDENLLGFIQGGATVTYNPTFYTAEDDLGLVSKKFITNEEVIFKSGVMTWSIETLGKLSSTARISEENGVRTLKVGGSSNYDGTSYLLRFVHTDKKDGDLRITLVGTNEAGFELSFAKDKETVINAEFKGEPCDNEGTLIIITEGTPTQSDDSQTGGITTKSSTTNTTNTTKGE